MILKDLKDFIKFIESKVKDYILPSENLFISNIAAGIIAGLIVNVITGGVILQFIGYISIGLMLPFIGFVPLGLILIFVGFMAAFISFYLYKKPKDVSKEKFIKIVERIVKKSNKVFYFYYPNLFGLNNKIGFEKEIYDLLKNNREHLQKIKNLKFLFVLKYEERNSDEKLKDIQERIDEMGISADKIKYVGNPFNGEKGGIIAGDKVGMYFYSLPIGFEGKFVIGYTKQAKANFEEFYNMGSDIQKLIKK